MWIFKSSLYDVGYYVEQDKEREIIREFKKEKWAK